MNDSSQTAAPTPEQSGRELARARRREMSHTGGAKMKAGSSNPRTSTRAATPVVANAAQNSVSPQAVTPQAILPATVETSVAGNNTKALTGKALSMARRSALAKTGSSSLPASANAASNAARKKPGSSGANTATSMKAESKLDESETSTSNTHNEYSAEHSAEQTASNAELDAICEVIESSPEASANAASSVHALCRDRRNTLSKKGKLGLPGKAGRQARKSLVRGATTSSLTGKALAKLHREDHCASGRGDTAACRPSGRVRPGASDAPAKVVSKVGFTVKSGTTLSGQSVSGTQVEQTDKVTGSETGACRAITGTEYLGVEQFTKLCSTIPQPDEAAPSRKAGLSETTHGQLMTGTNVAASNAASKTVTGAEAGDCKTVTGSEYLGVDHFQSVCSTKAGASQSVARSQQKVIEGRTSKSLRITGADEARDNAVTGSESGTAQNVTGSDYINMQQRSQSAVAPAKVDFSHTAAGLPVSGGESSRTSGITGDEQDACGRVTGTEYVSSERFVSTCGTTPAATTPAKVGVDASRGGMTITGNLVDRDNKVTGNEPGTCQRVTGSQYDSSANKDFCHEDSQQSSPQRSSKVHEMHTLHGRPLTGTEGSPSPKLTGDDRSSCSGVTGSDYVSQEYFQQSCQQTPQPSGKLTDFSQTWNNQVVSGVQTGHSQKTTGDEQGICKTVTGSNYAGREQVSEFCSAPAVAQSERRLSQHPDTPAIPVSGMTPAVDERMAGNFQRGQCQQVTGTPYQGLQDRALCNGGAPHHKRHHLAQAKMLQQVPQKVAPVTQIAEPYKADFSVMSPAKAAWQQRNDDPASSRVHSSVYARRSSITGAVNKAEGVISGTPEFRHGGEIQAIAPEMVPAQAERITGEGSESGTHITGDDWSRGGLVTGTEGLFSASRNQTQQGASVKRDHISNNIGAYALKGRERPEAAISKVTGGSGNTCTTGLVTLSGGASA